MYRHAHKRPYMMCFFIASVKTVFFYMMTDPIESGLFCDTQIRNAAE